MRPGTDYTICRTRSAFNPRLRLAALSTAFLCFLALPLSAGGPGSVSVQMLKMDMSPRAMGMGGAFAAIADDVYSVYYNPAGLARLPVPEASAMYLSGFEDSALQVMAFGMPLPFLGVADLEKPRAAISTIFSQSGKFTHRPIDANGNVAAVSMDGETNTVLGLTYAEKVYSGEANLEIYKATLDHYAGLSVKYIGSELLGKYSASAFAVDAGWLVREPDLGVTLGVSLSNYGSGITYLKETAPLPSILRLGASYLRPTIKDQSVLLGLETDIHTAEDVKSLRIGLEYHFEKILLDARLGYKALEDNRGPTFGLGVRRDMFSIDIGISLANEVFNSTQLSATYRFSGLTGTVKKRQVQYRDQEEPRPQPQKSVKPVRKAPAKPGRREPKKTEPVKTKPVPAGEDSEFFWIN